VAGGETGFHGDFKHFRDFPSSFILTFPAWFYRSPAGAAGFFEAALGLLEEGGDDSGEGDDEGDDEEDKAHGAPEGGGARGAGLLGDVGERDSAGDEGEEGEGGGEDVEVASHKKMA